MKQIAVIHGLNSTDASFNYIIEQLPECNITRINYSSRQPLEHSINECLIQLPPRPVILIGHSLGGVIATILASKILNIEALVTISAPLGGSKVAPFFQFIPGTPKVISDIFEHSPHIKKCKSLCLNIPTLSITSTVGQSPLTFELNDGVVALSSQRALKFAKHVDVTANHFEILTHPDTVKILENFIFAQ